MLENEIATEGDDYAAMPVFSGNSDFVTAITFTQAMGYGQSDDVTGDPVNGDIVTFANPDASVSLESETVSITYTGPY